jgi:nicotinate-nucleotide adenylyltransferase
VKLIDFINQNEVLCQQEELVFFGGSFNPWHAGHSSCLELMNPEKAIIVIPDHNPFKEFIHTDDKVTSVEQMQENIKMINNKNIFLYDDFFNNNNKNPTHIWISELKKEKPNIKLSLLMGFDTFMGIDKWIEAKQLLKQLYCLYVASRLDNPELKTRQNAILQEIAPIQIEFLGHHPFEELSSTKLRKNNVKMKS